MRIPVLFRDGKDAGFLDLPEILTGEEIASVWGQLEVLRNLWVARLPKGTDVKRAVKQHLKENRRAVPGQENETPPKVWPSPKRLKPFLKKEESSLGNVDLFDGQILAVMEGENRTKEWNARELASALFRRSSSHRVATIGRTLRRMAREGMIAPRSPGLGRAYATFSLQSSPEPQPTTPSKPSLPPVVPAVSVQIPPKKKSPEKPRPSAKPRVWGPSVHAVLNSDPGRLWTVGEIADRVGCKTPSIVADLLRRELRRDKVVVEETKLGPTNTRVRYGALGARPNAPHPLTPPIAPRDCVVCSQPLSASRAKNPRIKACEKPECMRQVRLDAIHNSPSSLKHKQEVAQRKLERERALAVVTPVVEKHRATKHPLSNVVDVPTPIGPPPDLAQQIASINGANGVVAHDPTERTVLLVGGCSSINADLVEKFARVGVRVVDAVGMDGTIARPPADWKRANAFLLIANYCSHGLAAFATSEAKKRGIPLIRSRNKWSNVTEAIRTQWPAQAARMSAAKALAGNSQQNGHSA